MPSQGDTSISHANNALASHGMVLNRAYKKYIREGGAPFHLLQEWKCRLVIQIKLINHDHQKSFYISNLTLKSTFSCCGIRRRPKREHRGRWRRTKARGHGGWGDGSEGCFVFAVILGHVAIDVVDTLSQGGQLGFQHLADQSQILLRHQRILLRHGSRSSIIPIPIWHAAAGSHCPNVDVGREVGVEIVGNGVGN